MARLANEHLDDDPDATPDDIYYVWSEALTLDYADEHDEPGEPLSMDSADAGFKPGSWVIFDATDAVKVTITPPALRRGRVHVDDIKLESVVLVANPGTRTKRRM